VPSESATLSEISGEQIYQLAKGHDIWALVAVMTASEDDTKHEQYLINGIPGEVQKVIHDHADLFECPTTLPPHRTFDHAISLYPDAMPVNCKPYRYSPEQKNKIEKQVAAMLQEGTVVPSVSTYASPVLLVKKKDRSWRFCVDYRKLNSSTINNKFPMLVIDEFLDEIAGAKFFTKLDLNSGFIRSGWLQQMSPKQLSKLIMGTFNFEICHLGLQIVTEPPQGGVHRQDQLE
jgi:hypothetical protein